MVFLLLVFFIYSFLSMSYHSTIPVNLPSASSGDQQEDKSAAVIGIHEDGSVSFGGTTVSMEELREKLLSVDEERGVLIAGDGDAAYRTVMEVCDTVRKSGIENFAFQVKTEKKGK